MVKAGSLESKFTPLKNFSEYAWKSATNRKFLLVTILYFACILFLSYLPTVAPSQDEATESGDKSTASSELKKQTLMELVEFAGVGLAFVQVFLVLLITLCAAILSSFTISVAAYHLCSWEDIMFGDEDAAHPFRALSLNVLPLVWWFWFEGIEKAFMMASITLHFVESLNDPLAKFVDYSLYAPLSNKDESFRFLISFSLITFVLGAGKVIVMSFFTSSSKTKPLKSMEKPKGLSLTKDISEETWTAAGSNDEKKEKLKKTGIKKRSKSKK